MSDRGEVGGNRPLPKRLQDLEDYQNELADRDTGRAKRFLPPGARGGQSKERQERERRNWSRLQMFLYTDPAFAALYQDTVDLLTSAETATEKALAKAEKELSDLLDKAAQLPDGRAVFMDKDGNARTESGKLVEPAIAAEIEWPDDAPSYEEYLERRQAVDEIRRYQVDVLGHARNHMTDPDNPPTKGELEQISQDIQDRMPATVRKEMPTPEAPGRPMPDSPLGVGKPSL